MVFKQIVRRNSTNEYYINENILDYCKNISQPYNDTGSTLKHKEYVEKLLGDRLEEGKLIIREIKNIEAISVVYLSVYQGNEYVLHNAYLTLMEQTFMVKRV